MVRPEDARETKYFGNKMRVYQQRAVYRFVEVLGEFPESEYCLDPHGDWQTAVIDDHLDRCDQFLGSHVAHRLQYPDVGNLCVGLGQQ